jgi:hypothetical protein
VQGAAAAGQGVAGSAAQAAGRGNKLPISTLSSRLFELLGIDLSTVQFAARQLQHASEWFYAVGDAWKHTHDVLDVKVS